VASYDGVDVDVEEEEEEEEPPTARRRVVSEMKCGPFEYRRNEQSGDANA